MLIRPSDNVAQRLLEENVKTLNSSLIHDTVLTGFKAAYITSRLKKQTLTSTTPSHTGRFLICKLLERLVARQLIDYLMLHKLMRDLQSSY